MHYLRYAVMLLVSDIAASLMGGVYPEPNSKSSTSRAGGEQSYARESEGAVEERVPWSRHLMKIAP